MLVERVELVCINGKDSQHPRARFAFRFSGQFGIVHWQCRAAALYLNGVWGKDPSCKWLKRNKCDPVEDLSGGIRFQKTYRHQLEVEHASYTRQLKRLVRQLKKNTGNNSQLIQ
jgi:hypothetical protein